MKYVYRADILCEGCGEAIREDISRAGQAPENPGDEYTYDSGDFPKGPYPTTEAVDRPEYCGICQSLLDSPLTENGEWYMIERMTAGGFDPEEWKRDEYFGFGHGNNAVENYLTGEELDHPSLLYQIQKALEKQTEPDKLLP